mmetsp:Transcript_18625/g.31858  ORF Transcript_18625/g.31858 Transcript_18625/m.31858 type:complete len:133 (+) Transcript_18625:2-400(+)
MQNTPLSPQRASQLANQHSGRGKSNQGVGQSQSILSDSFDKTKSTSHAQKFKQHKQNSSMINGQAQQVYSLSKNQIYNQDRIAARQKITGSGGLTANNLVAPNNPYGQAQGVQGGVAGHPDMLSNSNNFLVS